MTREDDYRRKADAFLRLASGADNMAERSRLIQEAVHWHNLALDAHDDLAGDAAWDDDQTDEARA